MATQVVSEHEAAYRPALEALAALDGDMANRSNAVGFSAADTRFGHDLVNQAWPWTPRQCVAVYRVLMRYAKTQLPALGFTPEDFPAPPDVASRIQAPLRQDADNRRPVLVPRPEERPRLWRDPDVAGFMARVRWPYRDPEGDKRYGLVRDIPGAQWDPAGKSWMVPVTATSVPGLSALLAAFAGTDAAFAVDAGLAEHIGTVAETLHASLAASRAHDADVHLMGLVEPELVRPFQRAGIAYMLEHKRVILADDMGTGKTLQSIATMTTSGRERILVVCPASLKLNWKREIMQWTGTPEHDIVICEGKVPDGELLARRWTIVNYDVLDGWKGVLGREPWDGVICDEAHMLKSGAKVKRGKAMGEVLKGATPEYVLMLTGTPVLNRPVELYPLLDMLGRAREFGGFRTYTSRYCNATVGRFGLDVNGASNTDELNLRLRSGGMMIRRRKQDILTELPPRIWTASPVEMTKAQTRAYDDAELALQAAIDAEEPGAVLVRIGELRQLAARIKLDAAKPWIDGMLESGEKLVVFAWHREITEEVAKRYGAPKIVGGQNRVEIEDGKRRFQEDEECRIISCNIAAGGVGHTLTAASNVLFIESAWNAALMDQALDRCHRMGQTADSVTGWVLSLSHPVEGTETIDDYMNEVVLGKRRITTGVADGEGEARQHAALDRMLGTLQEAETDELDGGDERDAAA